MLNSNIRELNRKLKEMKENRNEVTFEIEEREKLRKDISESINNLEKEVLLIEGIFTKENLNLFSKGNLKEKFEELNGYDRILFNFEKAYSKVIDNFLNF